jgi:hypothetical protein
MFSLAAVGTGSSILTAVQARSPVVLGMSVPMIHPTPESASSISSGRVAVVHVTWVLVCIGMLAHSLVALRHVIPRTRGELSFFIEQAFVVKRLGQIHEDHYEAMLRDASQMIPEGSTVLFLNPGVGRHESGWDYFRASYSLYPRPVWWGSPAPRQPGIDWHMQIPSDPSELRGVVSRLQVEYVLTVGIDPFEMPYLRDQEALWYDRSNLHYLFRLKPE